MGTQKKEESNSYILREHQEKAIQAVENAISQGKNKILVSMATGTGKNITIASLILRLFKLNYKRILFLVDRRVILEQFIYTFSRISDNIYPIKIVDNQNLLRADEYFIAGSTVQKLYNILFTTTAKGFDLGTQEIFSNTLDVIIVDECYSFSDKDDNNWVKVLDYFDAIKVGFSSSSDTRFHTVFKDLVFSYTLAQAMKDEYSYSIAENNLEYFKKVNKNIEEQSNKTISKNQLLGELFEAYRNEKLVFVLGAGVSKSCGLPDWNTLLQKLLITTFETDIESSMENATDLARLFTLVFPSSPLIAARYLGDLYKEKNKNTQEMCFEELIRKTIYKDIESDKESPLIQEIIQFCAAPGKTPNLDSIITFNYDDLLETNLSNQDIDIPYKSIYSIGMTPGPRELPIYHVHGFLPREGELTTKNQITLKEDMYHHQYNDIYSWNNIIQLNKYCDCTCLFIGISFTDPNLRRLLDIAMKQRGERKSHYMFRKKYDSKEIEQSLSQTINQNKDLARNIDINGNTLKEKAEYLAKMMQKFDEMDALSFGISIIWVDNYEKIPVFLRELNNKGKSKN